MSDILGKPVWNQVQDQDYGPVRNQFWDPVRNQVRDQVIEDMS